MPGPVYYYNGGFICIDKHGKIYLKYGGNVVPISDMCVFDGMLILLCGLDEHEDPYFPNLFYLKKGSYMEKGIISDGSASDEILSSEWPSRAFIARNDRSLRLERFVFAYFARNTHQGGEDAFTIEYKIDNGSWTILTTETLLTDGETHMKSFDKPLKEDGKLWRFKIKSDEDFEVLWWYPYFTVLGLHPDDNA